MRKLLTKNRMAIMLAAIFMQLCTNFPEIWAVFQQSAADAYGITLQESAMMLPMCTAFFGISSILGGIMQDKISPRLTSAIGSIFMSGGVIALSFLGEGTSILTLILCFSLPYGGGCGLIFPSMINPLMKWFADKKGFAMGTSTACSTGLLVVLTYLSKVLLSSIGMRSTVFIYGVTFFVTSLICSCFYVNPTDEYIVEKTALSHKMGSGAKPRPAVDFTPREMIKTRQYYHIFLAGLFATPAYMLIAPSIVTTAMARGLNANQAVSIVAFSNAASAVGKFVIPTLSDKIGRKKCAVTFLSLTFLLSILLMKAVGLPLMIIFPAMVLTHGGWATLITPFTNDMFGFRNAGTNGGFVGIYNTIAAFSCPFLAAALMPTLGQYTNNYIAIFGLAVAIILIFTIDPDTAKLKEQEA